MDFSGGPPPLSHVVAAPALRICLGCAQERWPRVFRGAIWQPQPQNAWRNPTRHLFAAISNGEMMAA